MRMESILRKEEEEQFASLRLHGKVLDLGGEKRSGYLTHVEGTYHVTTVNISTETGCDVVHDLEVTPLPFDNASYDAVILNNTIEHIYHARELVCDALRILRPGGQIIITAPFLFPVHPSPHDYWRFTDEAVRTMLKEGGVTQVVCIPLGTGVTTVIYHLFERLLPRPLRIVAHIVRPIAGVLDAVIYATRRRGSVQLREYYTLGYFVVGTK